MKATAVCLALALSLIASSAMASPWTLPTGDIVVSGAFNYQFATTEFLDDGGDQVFPLNGRYSASSYYLGIRGGFTDRFELEFQIPVRLVSYTSDPVLLLPRPDTSPLSEFDYYQENVVNLNRTKIGIGDLILSGRYQFLRAGPLVMAAELRIEAPTGYDAPSGTFGDNPTRVADFMANPAEIVTPENVSDDVTLGDGVLTLQPGILIGAAFPTRTFGRLDLSYRLRIPDAGDQIFASAKVGQFLTDWLLVFGSARLAYSITEGRTIGVSVSATDPSLPASEYGGFNNLALREVTLDRDALDVGAGALVRLNPAVEAVVGFDRTIWGRNTAAINTVYVGMALRTDVRDDPPEPVYDEEEYEEEEYEDEAYDDTAYEEGPSQEPPAETGTRESEIDDPFQASEGSEIPPG